MMETSSPVTSPELSQRDTVMPTVLGDLARLVLRSYREIRFTLAGTGAP
jgi:hypothetical protein